MALLRVFAGHWYLSQGKRFCQIRRGQIMSSGFFAINDKMKCLKQDCIELYSKGHGNYLWFRLIQFKTLNNRNLYKAEPKYEHGIRRCLHFSPSKTIWQITERHEVKVTWVFYKFIRIFSVSTSPVSVY